MTILANFEFQHLELDHQFTKTVRFEYKLIDGKEVYQKNEATLKANIYKLG